ncbi:MAG: hypothetical protein AB1668_07305, partial [Nanoarchaeota archaeon]
ILKLLAKYDVSGNLLGRLKTLKFTDQVKEFKLNAKKQLLVAMRETTEGKHFDEIIKDEYEKLKNDSVYSAEGYLYICLLYTYGILTPKNLLQKLTGCYGIIFNQKVLFPAPRIIIPGERGKGFITTQFRTRHQKIAYIIMSQIDELKDRGVKFERICSLISAVNIVSRRERYVVLKLLQGLIYPNPQEECNDRELAVQVMERHREKISKMQHQAAIEKKCPELFEWSSLYSKIGNFEENKKCLELIVKKIEPYNPRACYLYANVLNKLNPTPSKEQIEEIEEYFEQAYIGGYRDIKFLWTYLTFEVKVKHLEKVAQLCEEALKIPSENKKLKGIGYIYGNLISRLEQEDKYEELINICNIGLKVNPTNIKTRWKLAETLEHLGNKTEALNQYKEITKFKDVEEHARAWDKCASILLDDLGLYDDAEYFLQALINNHKKRDVIAAKCRNDMARLLVKEGKYDKVKNLWEEAIIIFPDFVYSYLELGDFYYQKENDIENAIKYIYEGKLIAEKNSIPLAIEKAEKILKEISTKIGDEKFQAIISEFERKD